MSIRSRGVIAGWWEIFQNHFIKFLTHFLKGSLGRWSELGWEFFSNTLKWTSLHQRGSFDAQRVPKEALFVVDNSPQSWSYLHIWRARCGHLYLWFWKSGCCKWRGCWSCFVSGWMCYRISGKLKKKSQILNVFLDFFFRIGDHVLVPTAVGLRET